MKLQFKHQQFQEDAAQAVVDVFAGQGHVESTYIIDPGTETQRTLNDTYDYSNTRDIVGYKNQRIILSEEQILKNLKEVQMKNDITPSTELSGHYNLTIEMETGVGKTYTYIKTIYELNRAYGWSKFIVIVPSVAIREGVYKSFQITEDHFKEEYGETIRYFIYNSSNLTPLKQFAEDAKIHVMIINSQAFNAKGKDARRIDMKLDSFNSRRPIDYIAKTNPILIIDEPQSVEGKQTKESMKKFNALFTLRYSATHREIYDMVYRLDAMDAYNQSLVKKIAVKGINQTGDTVSNGYLYLQSINLSKENPTATIQFNTKTKTAINKKTVTVGEKYNLYDNSNGLEEYKNGYTISRIDGRDNHIELINGIKIFAGDVIGDVSEEQLREIQIRETILSHIEREQQLYNKGIKVLSLFFIDEVAKYKQYDEHGKEQNGEYAKAFERIYQEILNDLQLTLDTYSDNINPETGLSYGDYLKTISAESTHTGYFSIDKKGKLTNSKLTNKTEKTSDDIDAYNLIMKNKELLLDTNPKRSPYRFIFSHSALREGWDNPNVFQICTLKQSASDVRRRQEVGRGLRLCVNQHGERQDKHVLGNDVHEVNLLTVIASEEYDKFARALQTEIAESLTDRPTQVTLGFFEGIELTDSDGNKLSIDTKTAKTIYKHLLKNDYLDDDDYLTDKYHEDKQNNLITFLEELQPYTSAIIQHLETILNPSLLKPENARSNNIEARVDTDKLEMQEFKELWKRINAKSAYVVNFDTKELVKNAVKHLDDNLHIRKVSFIVEKGVMWDIKSKQTLQNGGGFVREERVSYSSTDLQTASSVKYDLIGKLTEATTLTRRTVIDILKGIKNETFEQFKVNPEEFILKVAKLINEQKADAIINHITYNILDDEYSSDIFNTTIKGKLGVNAKKTPKHHLYDHLVYDSKIEADFAEELEDDKDVVVYVKLPNSFQISTPVGNYNPDWAIAFKEGNVKHVYFVAETKGSTSSLELRDIEKAKISCAKEHFKAISKGNVVYDVVDTYDKLLGIVRK